MAWPPDVAALRQEVQTKRSDGSLHRLLQASVNVVATYGLDQAVSEHHALQLAVVDVRFDALTVESKGSAQMVKNHVRARNSILIELSRLRTNAARGSAAGDQSRHRPGDGARSCRCSGQRCRCAVPVL